KLGDLARKVALVIAGKFEKAAVKRVPATMVQLGSQERNQAGVEPPRYIAADRHVRSHVYEHRVGQQLDKTPLEIAGAVIEVDVVLDVPIAPGGDRTVFDAKHVARKECRYALEERLLADRVLKRQVFAWRFGVGINVVQERQQRLCLGGE